MPLRCPSLLIVLGVLSASPASANNRPETRDVSLEGEEDQLLIEVLQASDADNDLLKYKVVSGPRNGQAKLEENGKLSYRPKKDWHGKDELTFEVSDGKASGRGKISVSISGTNDAPTPGPAVSVQGQEDKPVRGQVTGSDVDKDRLSFEIGKRPPHGSVEVDEQRGRFVYTPGENKNGDVAFTIEVTDDRLSAHVPVTVTLAPANDAPTAEDGLVKGPEERAMRGQLQASDVDGQPLRYSVVAPPEHGKIDVDAAKGTFVYIPKKDFNGQDAFKFEASDGAASARGEVALVVANVNDTPLAPRTELKGKEDERIQGKIAAKDADGDELSFALSVPARHGEAVVDRTTGAIVYTPVKDFHGADKFSLDVGDGSSATTTWVNIVIDPVNDGPVPLSDVVEGDEDKPISGKLRGEDVDEDKLRYSLARAAKNGSVEVSDDGSFQYRGKPHFYGEDSFRFEVTDGKVKAVGEMLIALRPVNDAPVATDVAVSTSEEKAVNGALPASDVDKDKLGWALGKRSRKGKVAVDESNGRFTYTPNENQNGDDSFTIVVQDGKAKAEATVKVAIAPVNDAPVATNREDSGKEDAPVTGKIVAADIDKDTLAYTVASKPRYGAVEVAEGSGAYTYTPNAHYNGEDTFKVQVSDGKLRAFADVKVAIAAVNDAPEPKEVAVNTAEDKAVSGAVPASDIDKDTLTWALAAKSAKGKVALDEANGRFTYTPNDDENGEDSFSVVVSDGNAKAEATVKVAIAPVNDVPVAKNHDNGGPEDAPVKGKVIASDIDKDTLAYTVASKPRFGTLALEEGSGAYTYTPNAHYNGEDAFKVQVSDGQLRTFADVKVAIAAVNDAPEPKEVALSTAEDKAVTGRVPASDIDKDVLTFRLKKPPAKGLAIVDDASGSFQYQPSRDAHGEDALVIEVTDGFASRDALVKVTVAPVPDAPVVDPRPIEAVEDEPVTRELSALDADGDAVSFRVITPSRLGDAEPKNDGKALLFTPKPDVHGEDELVLEATDGNNRTRATVAVRVAPRNDPPTVDEAKVSTDEETPLEIALTSRDKDGDPVTLSLGPAPKGADVVLSGNLLRVTPKRDFAGPLALTVVASDPSGKGPVSNVVVDVKNVNDAPVAKDLRLQATVEQAVSAKIDASDADAGEELTYSVAVPPRRGKVVIDDPATGRFTYTATGSASDNDDSFRIRVRDRAGAAVSATVTVRVSGGKPIASR